MAYTIRLFTSIADVDLAAWERVRLRAGASVFMDPRFIATVEISMKEDCRFWHVIVDDADQGFCFFRRNGLNHGQCFPCFGTPKGLAGKYWRSCHFPCEILTGLLKTDANGPPRASSRKYRFGFLAEFAKAPGFSAKLFFGVPLVVKI